MQAAHPKLDEFKGHPGAQRKPQLKDIKKRLPLRVLSPADWEHWTTNGYVIVQAGRPVRECRTAGRSPVAV